LEPRYGLLSATKECEQSPTPRFLTLTLAKKSTIGAFCVIALEDRGSVILFEFGFLKEDYIRLVCDKELI
jgi:hypothetical protein